MNYLQHPTAQAIAGGVVAAIAVLTASSYAGEGIATVEWLLALSAFLTVAFGLTTVQTRRELSAVREDIVNGKRASRNLNKTVDGRHTSYESRLSELESFAGGVGAWSDDLKSRLDVVLPNLAAGIDETNARVSELESGLAGLTSNAMIEPGDNG